MAVYSKPQYEPVSSASATDLRSRFEDLLRCLERAWHKASPRTIAAQGRPQIRVARDLYAEVWRLFDLRTRAVLYLSATESIGLDRRSLLCTGSRQPKFTEEELTLYAARFPETFFAYHCDLDWSGVEPTRLVLPRLKDFKVETVLPSFVYYVEYSLKGRHSHPVRTYITVSDGHTKLLDTWDYEEVLSAESDGLCYYIQ